MTERLPVATGSTQARGLKPAHRCNVAARKIHPDLASFRTGVIRGRRIAALCTTARHAIYRGNPGTVNDVRFGGMRGNKNGSATMCRTLKPIPNRLITWGRSL